MLLRRLIALAFLFTPAMASALTYSDVTTAYRDAPFTQQNAVAISVLTSLGAVSGYRDGTFRPAQTLNRAEAMKMITLSLPAKPVLNARNCFPDVLSFDWFSQYVCAAKDMGVVQGYLDGRFHPERNVLYAEALKMLVVFYGYPLTQEGNDAWYSPFIRTVDHQGVSLEENPMPLLPITRAQMTRLTVVFRADHDHELALYRQQETQASVPSSSMGNIRSSVSSATQSNASSASLSSAAASSAANIPAVLPSPSSSSSSSSVSAAQSSSVSAAPTLFIPLGQRSGALANVTVLEKEVLRVHVAKVQCTAKLSSVSALYLADQHGNTLAELLPDTLDPSGKSWIGTVPTDQPYTLPANTNVTTEIVAQLKSAAQGGTAGERVQISKLSLVVESGTSQATSELTLEPPVPFPAHETR